jgi:(Z)-2-((N-methylformamido)methylene)-5-hydroxybutyrolactone dehydrogenase
MTTEVEMEQFRLYIDGEFCSAEGGATFESIDPSTEDTWALMPRASAADTDRAVRAAWQAFSRGAWPALAASARGKLLYKLADLVARDAPIMAELETRDTGKIIRETKAQIGYVAEYYRYFAGLADKIEGAVLPIDKPDMEVFTRREPIGVVAAIVPWNSQLFLSAVKLGPALAACNCVVLKASEDGPAPLLHFARLVDEAGFPKGVVNVLTGFGSDCGAVLASHPLVSRVAFTGGPETARHIVRHTANNFAVTTLELGGKSPVIVFSDSNLDNVANAVVAGIFGASGQSCVAGSRLLVHESIHDLLLNRLATRAPQIRIGAPLDPATEMGPLATSKQKARAEKLIAESVQAGAQLISGGGAPENHKRGYYLAPTILTAPHAGIPCVQQEFFAPVLSVMSFANEDQAVELANGTDYGFAAGVFTTNLALAHRVTKRLRAGIVWINTYRAVSPMAPFGGFGNTGNAREAGRDAIWDYTRSKTVWINTSDRPIDDPFIMR